MALVTLADVGLNSSGSNEGAIAILSYVKRLCYIWASVILHTEHCRGANGFVAKSTNSFYIDQNSMWAKNRIVDEIVGASGHAGAFSLFFSFFCSRLQSRLQLLVLVMQCSRVAAGRRRRVLNFCATNCGHVLKGGRDSRYLLYRLLQPASPFLQLAFSKHAPLNLLKR